MAGTVSEIGSTVLRDALRRRPRSARYFHAAEIGAGMRFITRWTTGPSNTLMEKIQASCASKVEGPLPMKLGAIEE